MMSRTLELTRDEAENLVDLLELGDPKTEGWRFSVASDVREIFGMVSREEELKNYPK